MKKVIFASLIVILTSFCGTQLFAQGEQKAILFTGVVVGGKNTQRLPGAYIYIPHAGTGRLADKDGTFSLSVFPGDSIVYSHVGYKKQYQIIPRNYNSNVYSAIISLAEDAVLLSEVKIYPWSTEDEFKKALLALKLPDQADRDALAKSTDPEYIKRMAAKVQNNTQTNYRYTMDQQIFGREAAGQKGFVTSFSFLNPFAWSKFIKSVKNGDLKPNPNRKDLNESPQESINKSDIFKP